MINVNTRVRLEQERLDRLSLPELFSGMEQMLGEAATNSPRSVAVYRLAVDVYNALSSLDSERIVAVAAQGARFSRACERLGGDPAAQYYVMMICAACQALAESRFPACVGAIRDSYRRVEVEASTMSDEQMTRLIVTTVERWEQPQADGTIGERDCFAPMSQIISAMRSLGESEMVISAALLHGGRRVGALTGDSLLEGVMKAVGNMRTEAL